MSYAGNDEIRGVLIQSGPERVLLPNATVAEMVARATVDAVNDAPHWFLGELDWHGWKVPLLSFIGLAGLGRETAEEHNRVVVLKSLAENPQRPYVALLTRNFPQLVSVPRDGLLADASEETLPDSVHMRVLLGEQSALLPDLDALERALDSLPGPYRP